MYIQYRTHYRNSIAAACKAPAYGPLIAKGPEIATRTPPPMRAKNNSALPSLPRRYLGTAVHWYGVARAPIATL
jgi:hypothetical protein